MSEPRDPARHERIMAEAESIKALGYQQAPVVFAGGDHWSGFRPDKIRALAAQTADARRQG